MMKSKRAPEGAAGGPEKKAAGKTPAGRRAPPREVTSFNLPRPVLDWLDSVALIEGSSRSKVAERIFLEAFLAADGEAALEAHLKLMKTSLEISREGMRGLARDAGLAGD